MTCSAEKPGRLWGNHAVHFGESRLHRQTLDIVQKEGDVGRANSDNWRWTIIYKGVALIDRESMEIVQLHRERVDTNHNLGFIVSREKFFTKLEYDKVKIRDQYFTLPVGKTIEVYRKKDGKMDTVYKYKYSNYKVFTADVKIRYEEID